MKSTTMKHSAPHHANPSEVNFRKMLMLFLLPISTGALSAAEEPQPPVVDHGAPGGAPSDAIVLFDGKNLSRFRGQDTTFEELQVLEVK